MREIAKERLSKTADGQALIDLIELCGGRGAFLRITGFPPYQLDNWYARGLVSQEAATQIARMDWFKERGITRSAIRPGLTEHQWRIPANG